MDTPKQYKYKLLMTEMGVSEPCPFHNCKEDDRPAYHFGFTDISNPSNFVPGHKRSPKRINDPSDFKNCAYCGLSMYKSETGAREKWRGMDSRVKYLLQYTHLLVGDLKKEHGVVSFDEGEHFTLFEYDEVNLADHFMILDAL